MYDENKNIISNSNVNNTITYTGRRYDEESDLYYYRNRMYSPTQFVINDFGIFEISYSVSGKTNEYSLTSLVDNSGMGLSDTFTYENSRLEYDRPNIFVDYENSRLKSMGNPHEKAIISAELAKDAARTSAALALIPHSATKIASKIVGTISAFLMLNSYSLSADAGTYNQDALIIDVLTTATTYVKNPVLDAIYDEVFVQGTDIMFNTGNKNEEYAKIYEEYRRNK